MFDNPEVHKVFIKICDLLLGMDLEDVKDVLYEVRKYAFFEDDYE